LVSCIHAPNLPETFVLVYRPWGDLTDDSRINPVDDAYLGDDWVMRPKYGD